jgi:hypothetical protein
MELWSARDLGKNNFSKKEFLFFFALFFSGFGNASYDFLEGGEC